MSWLDDLNATTVFKYSLEDGDTLEGTLQELAHFFGTEPKGVPGEELVTVDGKKACYAGFEANKIRQKSYVEFEQHGRKAVCITDEKGKKSYISKTKLHYLKTGKVEGQYSNAFKEASRKNEQQAVIAESRRHSKGPTMKDLLKGLPDGEYMSNGRTFMNAKGFSDQIKDAKKEK